MNEAVQAFEAEIAAGRGGGAYVEIPFSVQDVYGTRGRVKVRATLDGNAYCGSIAPMGGGIHVLGVRKDLRAQMGKGIGDVISVTLREDTEPRSVAVPPELASTLGASAEVGQRFESLSYTHRREFAEWVAGAKKPETRDRRARKAIEMIIEGKTR